MKPINPRMYHCGNHHLMIGRIMCIREFTLKRTDPCRSLQVIVTFFLVLTFQCGSQYHLPGKRDSGTRNLKRQIR